MGAPSRVKGDKRTSNTRARGRLSARGPNAVASHEGVLRLSGADVVDAGIEPTRRQTRGSKAVQLAPSREAPVPRGFCALVVGPPRGRGTAVVLATPRFADGRGRTASLRAASPAI